MNTTILSRLKNATKIYKKIILFLFATMGVFILSGCSKEYTWYQETHIKVTSTTGIYENRTINSVSWESNKQISKGLHVDAWTVVISGGAPFVELPNGLVIVVSVNGGSNSGLPRILIDDYFSEQRIKLTSINTKNIEAFLNSEFNTKDIEIPSLRVPYVIGFSDRHDPSSAFFVELLNPALSELGVENIEITISKVKNGKPDSTRLLELLPWLKREPFIVSVPSLNGDTVGLPSHILHRE